MSDYGSTPPPPAPAPGLGRRRRVRRPAASAARWWGRWLRRPAAAHGGMAGPVDHPKGMTVLVLGILSIVCCSPLGIVALVMGNNALKEIDAQPGRYGNRQIVQIGRILGIVGIVLLVLGLIWVVFLGGLAAISGDNTSM